MYFERFFTPQVELLPETTQFQDEKWVHYLFGVLIPALLNDDEVLRNILRGVGALPSRQGLHSAVAALCRRFGECLCLSVRRSNLRLVR